MKITYLTILANQALIPEMFSDERWIGMPLEEKEEIVYSMFHINNWRQLGNQYRIYFLQELENIYASKQNRKPFTVIMLKDMTTSVQTGEEGKNEIHVSSEYLLNGTRDELTIQEDGTQVLGKKQVDNLNVELFCSICHEGEHAKQEQGIKNNVDTREIKECKVNLAANPNESSQNNRIAATDDPILYKLQPVEYYAFLNSEATTKQVFTMLQTKFGIDEGYNKWYKKTRENSFEALAQKWNKDNKSKEECGVEWTELGIRKMLIHSMMQNIQEWYDVFSGYEFCGLDFKYYSPNISTDWVDDRQAHDEK